MNTWQLPSHDGWNVVEFETQVLHRKTNEIEHKIKLKGRNWYQPGLLADAPEYKESEQFVISLPTVLILKSKCQDLLSHFDQWLNSSTPFKCTLRSEAGEFAEMALSERDELITKPDNPAFTFLYQVSRCRIEVLFVVDQSCVRIARDGLARVLESYSND